MANTIPFVNKCPVNPKQKCGEGKVCNIYTGKCILTNPSSIERQRKKYPGFTYDLDLGIGAIPEHIQRLKSKPTTSDCINRQTPFNLTEVENITNIIFYTEIDKIYCFEYADVDGLIAHPINPYTNRNFHPKFIEYLKNFRKTNRYKEEEAAVEEKVPEIKILETDVDSLLQRINRYISVDQFFSLINRDLSASLLPHTVDPRNKESVVRYLYNNRHFNIGGNKLIYMIVQYAFNKAEISNRNTSQERREVLESMNRNIKHSLRDFLFPGEQSEQILDDDFQYYPSDDEYLSDDEYITGISGEGLSDEAVGNYYNNLPLW